MYCIIPKAVTTAMVASASIAEDARALWSATSTYAVGAEVYRATTHRWYRCAAAVNPASTIPPELAPTSWADMGPTNLYAGFDNLISTPVTATGSLTIVLSPGYVNAIYLAAVVGKTYSLTMRQSPGGTVRYTKSGRIKVPGRGWWSYLFWPWLQRTSLAFTGIPMSPTAEITLTITGAPTDTVSLGMFVVGAYRSLMGSILRGGGPQNGATATPRTYSYIDREKDGTAKIIPGNSATDLRVELDLPIEAAEYLLANLREVLDKPVVWIASDSPGYRGLATFGLAKTSPVTHHANRAKCTLDIEGFV